MKQSELLSELKAKQEIHILQLEHYKNMDEYELSKHPKDGGWNALECIAHLNIFASHYNKEFKKQVDEGKARTGAEYKPGLLGGRTAESMLPDSQGRLSLPMPTLKKMNPKQREVNRSILDRFLAKEKELLALLGAMENIDMNLNSCKLTIPLLKFSLGDTLRFHIYHNERHLQQANRLLI
jgi:hypothetical protein